MCVISAALDATGSVKCTTAQLHISFDCQFVLRAARGFEPRLEMKAKPCPQCVHCRPLLLLICFRHHQGLRDYFSIVLRHAGMSIMYNLSYNTSRDSTPSRLHFNLMPLLFLPACCVDCGQCIIPLRYIFIVSSRQTLILLVPMVRASVLISLFLLPLRGRIQYQTAKDQTSSFSSVSRSQLLMYKMKQCYKPNKNVLPLDSPTVNIWPLISVNILHNYVWL